MSTRRIAPRHGFTLIELLVVIAVIALLAALIMPALQKAREASRTASCQTRLRQVGMAVETYRADFSYWYPPNNLRPTPSHPIASPWGTKEYFFDELLVPYLNLQANDLTVASGFIVKQQNYLACPSNPAIGVPQGNAANLRNWISWPNTNIFNYNNTVFFGNNYGPTNTFLYRPKKTEPLAPSITLLSMESKGLFRQIGHAFPGTNLSNQIVRFHANGTSNFLLGDGHVTLTDVFDNASFRSEGFSWWDPRSELQL